MPLRLKKVKHILIRKELNLKTTNKKLIRVAVSICLISAFWGCETPPEASKQTEIETPIEEPAHKVDRPNPIAPIYPSQIPSNTKSVDTTPLRKPAPTGATNPSSKSGSAANGSKSSGKGVGSGSGEGKAGSGSSGNGTGNRMGNGNSTTTDKSTDPKQADGASTAQSGSSTAPAQSSQTTPSESSQTVAKGEVEVAGKAKRKSAKDFFSETPPPPPEPASSKTTAPANQPATTPSKNLDFSEVAPTEAPLPNSKPSKETDAGAVKLVLPFRGCWRQVDCDAMNAADFALGGYSQRYLIFNEGQGEMRVYCGFGDSAKQRIAIRYRFISKGDGLMTIEPAQGAADALELIPAGATPPTSMTANVTWTLTPDGAGMKLSGKNYVRVSDGEGRAFSTGEKVTIMPPKLSTPTLFALSWIEGDTLIIFDSSLDAESRSNSLSELRNSFREQAQGRRAILLSPNSTLPLTWEKAGTATLMKQVATAESSGSTPLTTSRLGDFFRSVPSTPMRILIIAKGSLRPSDIADLMEKRTWTCPVDVAANGSATKDEWRAFANKTGGKFTP